MTFEEYIDNLFKANLELAREELAAVNNYYKYSSSEAWDMAIKWTIEDVSWWISYTYKNWWEEKE